MLWKGLRAAFESKEINDLPSHTLIAASVYLKTLRKVRIDLFNSLIPLNTAQAQSGVTDVLKGIVQGFLSGVV